MSVLLDIKNFILDILFPITCLNCGKDNEWLCRECLAKIPLQNKYICPWCEKRTTPDGRICFNCRGKTSLDGLLPAASYKNQVVASAIHCYKYRFAKEISEPLGEILVRAFSRVNIPLPDAIIPVPLHPQRLRFRGFNQSKLLADYLSECLAPGFSIPVIDSFLLRAKNTRPQMKIKNYFRRRQNTKNAFAANPHFLTKNKKNVCEKNREHFLQNKRILLVDDVATTGATLFECAKILKNAGAREVFAIVAARQELR